MYLNVISHNEVWSYKEKSQAGGWEWPTPDELLGAPVRWVEDFAARKWPLWRSQRVAMRMSQLLCLARTEATSRKKNKEDFLKVSTLMFETTWRQVGKRYLLGIVGSSGLLPMWLSMWGWLHPRLCQSQELSSNRRAAEACRGAGTLRLEGVLFLPLLLSEKGES